jgi:hypothetical protein
MDFIYEAGGIVINQKSGNIMYSKPYLYANYVSTVDITYDVVNFTDISGKKYSTGYGKTPILLDYIGKNTSTINNVDTIKIITGYTLAWHNFLNSTLSACGLTYGSSNDFIIIEDDNEISVDFNDVLTVDINIRISEINIQIGPGWVIK